MHNTIWVDALQELYEQLGWPLYKRHGHAFDAFKQLAQDPDTLLAPFTPDVAPVITDSVRDALMVNIRRRMTPQPLKIRADVELTCFAYDGVLHIKEAMRAAQAVHKEGLDCSVNMKLVAPPLYVLTTQTLDKEAGIKLLEDAIAAATTCIDARKGRLVVKEGARAVSERDEKLLAEKLDKLAAANEEVDGDEEDEEDETMGTADFDAPPMPGAEGGKAEPRAAKAKALQEEESDED
jgi:translation initiation factor 2 subunit 1